jgi:hypothetical protein
LRAFNLKLVGFVEKHKCATQYCFIVALLPGTHI